MRNVWRNIVIGSVSVAATAAVFAAGALAHGGNNDPDAIHACVNRFGEVRILGFQGLSVDGPCPMLGGPWTNVHWSITGPSGPSGPSGAQRPSGPSGPSGPPGPTEGVGSDSTAPVTPPATLTNQLGFSFATESQFTTTISGKLHLSKPFTGRLDCPGTVWWWIALDGTPIRSSLLLVTRLGDCPTRSSVSRTPRLPQERTRWSSKECVSVAAQRVPVCGRV
jgi:hypothetical protein